MCELLISRISRSVADSEKDRRGCYKEGMTITVEVDGWGWTPTERGPRYQIIEVPGIDVADVLEWLAPQYVDDEVPEDEKVHFRRRRRAFKLVALTHTNLQILQNEELNDTTRLNKLRSLTFDYRDDGEAEGEAVGPPPTASGTVVAS